MRSVCCLLLGFLFLGSCKNSFTSEEKKIIREGEGVMRLWTADDRQEEVFLRQQARPLKPEDGLTQDYQRLKRRMIATVTDTANPGVGIAAPQVGIGCRLIAVQRFDKEGEPFEFYINPEIIYYSEQKVCGQEGCLSIPNVADSVWRSAEIIVRYQQNSPVEDTVRGFTAVIFQHEIDHLNGVLFTDRVEKKND